MIPGCKIYKQADECEECDEGKYLATPGSCVEVTSSDDKCIKFDPTSS